MKLLSLWWLIPAIVVSAQAADTLTIALAPAMTFDLVARPESRLPANCIFDAIKLTENDVFLSFRGGTASRQRGIIRASRLGSVIATTLLPHAGTPLDVAFDDFGDAFVLQVMPDRTARLERYSAAGLSLSIPLFSLPRALAIVANQPLILGSDGSLTPTGSESPAPFRNVQIPAMPESFHLVAIDDHTVALLDKFTPSLRIADLSRGSAVALSLDTPEVRQSMKTIDQITARAPGRPARPVLFFDATGDGRGHLFMAVAPGTLSGGMLVNEVDHDAKHVRSLRLLPSPVARLKREGNPNGWVLQRKLSIAGSTIATTSSEGVVSLFQSIGR